MKRIWICSAAALLLVACGPAPTTSAPEAPVTTAPSSPPAIPTDPSAGPSGADNMTWQYIAPNTENVGTQLARLMYASYGSEGMALNLQCDGDTVFARLWRGQQRASWPFALQSGAVQADLVGSGEGESEVVVTASLPLSAPVLASFRDSGDLSLIEGGQTQVLDAINDAERAAITAFFQACG